jgi:hypothetical protein
MVRGAESFAEVDRRADLSRRGPLDPVVKERRGRAKTLATEVEPHGEPGAEARKGLILLLPKQNSSLVITASHQSPT